MILTLFVSKLLNRYLLNFMAQLSDLPPELWELIFLDKVLISYSHLLSLICKKAHNICRKHKKENILDLACKNGAGWISDPDQLATRSMIAAWIF